MAGKVHVIGGGLAGSEAAWQIAQAGVAVVLHEMRPVRQTDAHQTGAFAELVCSNSFRSDEWETNAVGLLHEEMRRAASLIMAAADANKLPAGGALAVDREGFAADVTPRARGASFDRDLTGGDRGAAARRMGQRDRRHGPPHLACARARHPGADRRGRARLLRCHRADRASRVRSTCRCAGGSRATTKRGRAEAAPITSTARSTRASMRHSSPRCLPPRRPRSRRSKAHPYFEGCLPIEVMAERGRRDAALRTDEAGRSLQPASAGREALCRGAAASGQCAGHAMEHGRVSDQAETWRAGARVPHHSRASSKPSSRGSAGCIATPSSTARNCSMPPSGSKPTRGFASRARSPASRAMSKSAAIGLIAGRFAAAERLGRSSRRRRRPRRSARCSITSPAAISAPTATARREASSR